MKSNTFKATYSSWLKTHDKFHKEYQRRKRYPWHIIGGIEFSEELIGVTQSIYNKNQVLLGEVIIKNITKRIDENKIQFEFQLSKDLITEEFCIVFLTSGLLITIFDLGKDLEKESIKKYLKGDNVQILSAKRARQILLEFVWRKLKGLNIYEKQVSFERIVDHKPSSIQPKENFIVDISKNRELWIFISLFEYEANPIEIRYSGQCNDILSLYLVPSKFVPNRSPNNGNIIAINRYFSSSLTENENEILERLRNEILRYAKFK